MAPRHVGAAVRRSEDRAFLLGQGRFLEDLRLAGLLHAAFVRSPHAHARILGIALEAARRLAGVVAVYTFDDFAQSLRPLPPLSKPPAALTARLAIQLADAPQLPLARHVVRYVGEPVALVVAVDRYVAEDALALIEVTYEPLPAVTDALGATETGAPVLHAAAGDNVAFSFLGAVGDVERAFRGAAVVLREEFRIARQAAIPLEPRGVAAVHDRRDGTLTTWNGSQHPHYVQLALTAVLGAPAHKVRVIVPDVGGGFGVKAAVYPEDVLIPLVARDLDRPVRWIETRREHLMAATHSRDQLQRLELAAAADGRLLGLRGRIWLDVGAYNPGGFTLAYNTLAHMPGPYRLPALAVELTGVFTNKTPVAPYRGAGRPEAAFGLDRFLDQLARQLSIDPVELRLRNMVRPEAMPYDTGLLYRDGNPVVYDSGDFPAILRMASSAARYDEFRKAQAGWRARGVHRGIGVSYYVEATGLGPYEGAVVRVDRSGRVVVASGACSQGQGHETVFAQIAADALDAPLDWVTVIGGDTDRVTHGVGTFASRSAVMAGNAIHLACRTVRDKLLAAAARCLEAPVADLEIEDGHVRVRGTPSSALPFAAVVQASVPTFAAAGDPAFEATAHYHAPNLTYASGAHVAEVEVDAETGRLTLLRYLVAHDCGRLINPMIVDGQVHGGVVQGIGGALWEEIRYDAAGQLMTGTLLDYAIPAAADVPFIETRHAEFPSPRNPLGIKGAGEGGTIAPPSAIASAIEDALAPFGVHITRVPMTASEIARLVAQAAGSRKEMHAP
jgi:carbon-monoxide dehydrogenase large subunit